MFSDNVFEKVKDYVKPTQCINYYLGEGRFMNGAMWYRSPFRNEKTASFCANDKKGIHDFGSNEHYDVISFVEKHFDLKPLEAVNRLISDFNLPIEMKEKEKGKSKLDYDKERAEYFKARKEKEEHKKYIEQYSNKLYCKLAEEFRFWHNMKLMTKYFDIEFELLPLIYKEYTIVDYLINQIQDLTCEEIYENRKKIEDYFGGKIWILKK